MSDPTPKATPEPIAMAYWTPRLWLYGKILLTVVLFLVSSDFLLKYLEPQPMDYLVARTPDFELDGLGTNPNWSKAPWVTLSHVGVGKATYETRARVLHSEKGVYFFVDCEDKKLTCTMTKDQSDIYKEDVVEVFMWPDEKLPLYFEYEISPLNVELTIIVPNVDGKFYGWLPWHYDEPGRQTRRVTKARGGPAKAGASVDGWTTEFFIPYLLLNPLNHVPPKPGSKWRANIYRIDYDAEPSSQWAMDPATGGNFHNYKNFGSFTFE